MKKLLLLLASSALLQSAFAQTPKFIEVEGGTFMMGSNKSRKNEGPVHRVTLNTYSISETPITVAQYKMYCNNRGMKMPDPPSWGWKDNHPIVNVSWADAINYCNWLSSFMKRKIQLPTEAQWEFAARGGTKSKGYKHSGAKKMNHIGWCRVQDITTTQAVRSKKPNELGIYDMSGNTWEWCMDWYDPNYYKHSSKQNPENKTFGEKKCRVARGGGWDSEHTTCTVTHRKDYIPKSNFDDRGFRVVAL